jgi:hypothetical protein
MSDTDRTPALRRATKVEVLALLGDAHVALVHAAEAMTRRYGLSEHVAQLYGAAAMITDDWMPAIRAEREAAPTSPSQPPAPPEPLPRTPDR